MKQAGASLPPGRVAQLVDGQRLAQLDRQLPRHIGGAAQLPAHDVQVHRDPPPPLVERPLPSTLEQLPPPHVRSQVGERTDAS